MTVTHARAPPLSQSHQTATTKEMAPEHPLVRALLGLIDQEIQEVAEQVY